VEGTVIFEGKKTEIVDLTNIQANVATNNGRQIFNRRVAGLNVWEKRCGWHATRHWRSRFESEPFCRVQHPTKWL
jgi:hypothetical protein